MTLIKECDMSGPRLSSSPKRQLTKLSSPCLDGASQRQRRKPKLNNHPTKYKPDESFGDSLSKIWLTKRALQELDRRNARLPPNHLRQTPCSLKGPSTQGAIAKFENPSLSQSAAEFLNCSSPTTVKDIQHFARHGGPNLSDLRGYRELLKPLNHKMSSSQSSQHQKQSSAATPDTEQTPSTERTKSSGPYSADFQQKLVDGGVYPLGYRHPDGRKQPKPSNWEEIKQRLQRHRPSLSQSAFSEGKFEEFEESDLLATTEHEATKYVIPTIEGRIADRRCVGEDLLFTNLNPLTDEISARAKPDLYYGARPEQLDRSVRDRLSKHIIPSKREHRPMVPNFFLETKAPSGSAEVAQNQACYYGALGARGMHSLQSDGQSETVHDNNAYTISSTYQAGTLKLFTCHPSEPTATSKGRPEYNMNKLNVYGMTGNADTFRQGATAFRNARDLAKEWRDAAIHQANERSHNRETGAVNASSGTVSSFTNSGSGDEPDTIEAVNRESPTSPNEDDIARGVKESETSLDPLASDLTVPVKRSNKHSKRVERRPPKRRQPNRGAAGKFSRSSPS